jgi:ligand-binding sensor domain-containing protein
MKRTVKRKSPRSIGALLLASIFSASCNGQKAPESVEAGMAQTAVAYKASDSIFVGKFVGPMPNPVRQISQYIRRMFQDKAGNIWFGTNGEGVCRFDGKNYVYFSPTDLRSGFCGEAVRGIVQDDDSNIWFATNNGVSRFDGKTFTNFKQADGLKGNQVWSILKDESGVLWFGTENGVSRYDGKVFTDFNLPQADVTNHPGAYPAARLINNIFQDKSGNIWLASNGNGVYRYDGKSIRNFSAADGLCDNFVQCTIEDRKGNLWFATRFGGVSRYDGKSFVDGNRFTTFTQKDGLGNNFAWIVFEDKAGNIWIGNAGGGLTRYDGKKFTHFSKDDGLQNLHIQSILQDKNGLLWIGTSGGAYQFDGEKFINITRDVSKEGC